MRIRTRMGIVLALLMILLGVAAAAGLLLLPETQPQDVENRTMGRLDGFSLEDLREDHSYAVATILERHPLLYSNEQKVLRIAARQYARLTEGMTAIEFYRNLAPVVEALECGHSNLQMDKEYIRRMARSPVLLPLHLQVEGEALLVRESIGSPQLPPGSRILEINGHSAPKIVRTLLAGITSDGRNVTSKLVKIDLQFAYYYHLLVDESGTFDVRYVAPANDRDEGLEAMASLSGVSAADLYGKDRRPSSVGLYMDFSSMRHDFEGEVNATTAYLRVGSFILDQREFAGFLEEFFEEVAAVGSNTLVLDLRGNWGGPPRGSALLYSYLVEEPGPYLDESAPFYFARYKRPLPSRNNAFTGDLTVLVDGAVFSTTAHLVSLLQQRHSVELRGERTGGSAACTDSSRRLRLPNTRLRLYYATRIYSTPAPTQNDGRGISPAADDGTQSSPLWDGPGRAPLPLGTSRNITRGTGFLTGCSGRLLQ